MKKIFITALFRYRARDFWGMAISEDGEILAEADAKEIFWLKYNLGLEGSISRHENYSAHYPDGYELIFVDQDHECEEFKLALRKLRLSVEQRSIGQSLSMLEFARHSLSL